MVWKCFFFLLYSWKVEAFGKCKDFIRRQSLLWRVRTDWHPKSLNDTHTSRWQCMFAHTLTEEALASCCPGIHSERHQSFLPPSTPSTLRNPCMCHSREHSQKPRAVPFSKISPVKASVCLYYEKPMEINTLSINIVYSSKSVCLCLHLVQRGRKQRLQNIFGRYARAWTPSPDGIVRWIRISIWCSPNSPSETRHSSRGYYQNRSTCVFCTCSFVHFKFSLNVLFEK